MKSKLTNSLIAKPLIHYLYFIPLSLLFATLSFSQESGNLTFEITGLRNQNGKILISLYSNSIGFPNSPQSALYNIEAKIENNRSKVWIENLPHGDYAASLIHDENNNQKVDKNFMGIPKEGIGFSNNVSGTFGPPDFESARFNYSKNQQVIKIKVVYY